MNKTKKELMFKEAINWAKTVRSTAMCDPTIAGFLEELAAIERRKELIEKIKLL